MGALALSELFCLAQVRWPGHVAVHALPLLPNLRILDFHIVRLLKLTKTVPERFGYYADLRSASPEAEWSDERSLWRFLCWSSQEESLE